MKFKLNNRGIGLPTVLGIVTFVIAIAASLLTFAVFQARLVDQSFEQTEAYANAVQSVDATIKIIVRDQNLEPQYLSDLETYMGVTIDVYSAGVYTITSMITATQSITSYLTGSASAVDTFDSIFQNTGQEQDFILSPLATPSNLMSTYIPQYFEENFPWLTPETNFTSIDDIVEYIKDLADDNSGFDERRSSDLENAWDPTAWWHWYIDDDVTIPNGKNLTIPDNRLLVIDGDLTMNRGSTLTGNVIVNGKFKVNGKSGYTQYIYGTVYAKDDVTLANYTKLGSISRPSFILTEKDVFIGKYTEGYGYFLSRNLSSTQRTTTITGGTYVTGTLSLKNDNEINSFLDSDLFYSYAIPESIDIEGDGGSSGTTSFKFTSPTLD